MSTLAIAFPAGIGAGAIAGAAGEEGARILAKVHADRNRVSIQNHAKRVFVLRKPHTSRKLPVNDVHHIVISESEGR